MRVSPSVTDPEPILSPWLTIDQAEIESRRTAAEIRTAIARRELRAAYVGSVICIHEAWLHRWMLLSGQPQPPSDYKARAAHDDGDAA